MSGAFEPFSLDQMTMFLAVVEHGGFSAAARALGRVQSAVSHSVGTLEQTLGAELFDRSQRPLGLTEAGQRLAAEARLVLVQARQLRHVAGAIREGTEARLALAVEVIYPRAIIAALLAEFHRAFPTVTLRVETELLAGTIERVRGGQVDLGVCNLHEAHNDPALAVQPAGRVQLWGVCAPGHPLAREPAPQRTDRLQHATQLVLTERTETTVDRGVLAPRTWRVTDLQMKLDLLRAGIGWGNLPAEIAAPAIEAGELVRLEPEPWQDGRYDVLLHTVVRADRPLGPAGSWLRQRLVLPT